MWQALKLLAWLWLIGSIAFAGSRIVGTHSAASSYQINQPLSQLYVSPTGSPTVNQAASQTPAPQPRPTVTVTVTVQPKPQSTGISGGQPIGG